LTFVHIRRSAEDPQKNTKFFSWMTDEQALAQSVKMKGEGSEEVYTMSAKERQEFGDNRAPDSVRYDI